MEDKLLRIFSIVFFLVCVIFTISVTIELYVYITKGTFWIPIPYFFLAFPIPIIGYLMMIIGEYIDKKK